MSVLRKHTTPKCRSEVSVMRLGGGVPVNGKTLLGLSTYLNLLNIRNNSYRSNLSTVTSVCKLSQKRPSFLSFGQLLL